MGKVIVASPFETVSARPSDTANNDDGEGDGDDDKDLTTLTSATTEPSCQSSSIATEIALTIDDGVSSSFLNVLDPFAPCSTRPPTSRSWCNIQSSILNTFFLWIFLLWHRRFPKPEFGKYHGHPRRSEWGCQLQGGRFRELAMAAKVAVS